MEAIISCTSGINRLKKSIEKHQFKILIVDDDIEVAKTFCEILQERGHSVTIANEGISCISKCQNSCYDIIFMDYHLHDISGIDTTDLIKNNCSVKSIIFAFTGDDSTNALSKFKNIGMSGALIKPLDIDLINKLMTSLEIRNNVDTRVIKNIRDLKLKKQLFVFEQTAKLN
jgi:CheY-like chemotaxis protein